VKWIEDNSLTSPPAQVELEEDFLLQVQQQFLMKPLLWIIGEFMFAGEVLLPVM